MQSLQGFPEEAQSKKEYLSSLSYANSAMVLSLGTVLDQKKRLEDLGLRKGMAVRMLKNEGLGPVLIQVMETTIALDRDLANSVRIRSN